VAAKPSGKITNEVKSHRAFFAGRDNAKFTAMSALPPKADIGGDGCDVRFVPLADSRSAAKDRVIRSPRRREPAQCPES
jgi:hypothetical protein